MTDLPKPFRRARSKHDRDVLVPKHGDAPEFVEEEATGRYTGPELARIRSRRPTPERISKVETRQDKLESVVTELRVDIAGRLAAVEGSLGTLVTLASKADAERERRVAAEAVALEKRRKHVIALISAVGVAIAGIVAAGVV